MLEKRRQSLIEDWKAFIVLPNRDRQNACKGKKGDVRNGLNSTRL